MDLLRVQPVRLPLWHCLALRRSSPHLPALGILGNSGSPEFIGESSPVAPPTQSGHLATALRLCSPTCLSPSEMRAPSPSFRSASALTATTSTFATAAWSGTPRSTTCQRSAPRFNSYQPGSAGGVRFWAFRRSLTFDPSFHSTALHYGADNYSRNRN